MARPAGDRAGISRPALSITPSQHAHDAVFRRAMELSIAIVHALAILKASRERHALDPSSDLPSCCRAEADLFVMTLFRVPAIELGLAHLIRWDVLVDSITSLALELSDAEDRLQTCTTPEAPARIFQLLMGSASLR